MLSKKNKPSLKQSFIAASVIITSFAMVGGLIFISNPNPIFYLGGRASSVQKQHVYSHVPESQVSTYLPGEWTFDVSLTNKNPSDWTPADDGETPSEDQVFWQMLTHKQSEKDWTIKIGKGGQFFSISTPQTGEMIARQRTTHGQWVDEVYQHVIPSTHSRFESPSKVDGDIHQAGYYTKSDIDSRIKIIPKSVYSPTFVSTLSQFINKENSVSYITWPQHAHLPRAYSENGMVMHQNIRDVGDGVVEITLVIDKWSGEETTAVNVPFMSLRTENIPYQFISLPDGSFKKQIQEFSDKGVIRLKDQTTGGWLAFTNGNSADSYGMAVVYGKPENSIGDKKSYVRWGNYGGGTIADLTTDVSLLPGDSVFFRYYLVFGSLKDLRKYGNMLADKTHSGWIETPIDEAKAITICTGENGILRRGCPDGNENALFILDREHTKNSLPVFLLRKHGTQEYLLSADPYSLSSDPTDGQTDYLSFMGWVQRNEAMVSSDLTNYKKLKSLLENDSQIKIDRSLNNAIVRVSLSK